VNSGGANNASGLTRLAPAAAREDEARERASEQATALWLALAQRVAGAQPLPVGELEPPSAWRGSAGVLTPGAPAPGATGVGGEAAEAVERMTLRVDGGSLGELEVTLDRENGALRVIIGLENERFVNAVKPDAHTLRSALENAGLRVQSLNVVRASEVGTVLAERRSSGSVNRAAQDAEASDTESRGTDPRYRKRLTLIG